MNRDIPGRSFFVAAYLILAIGFLTVHFTRVESFSAVVGPVTVKGRSSVGTTLSPPQIRRIRLNVNGLELGFRKNQRAFLITDDGIRHPLSVTDWNADDDSVRIVFSNDTAFEMTADPHGTGLRLIPSVPTTVPPVRSIELPFEPEGGTEMTVTADRPGTLEIRDGDREYIAELPADSRWDPGSRRLNLVVLDKADPILTIADDRRGAGLTAEEWIDQGNGPAGSAYERAVEDWIGVVRAGWESRIDPRSGLWTDASGNPRWSDELASALLADAVSTGSLPSRLQDVLSAADRSPTTIGWLPSPYLGNIVNQNRVHSQELRTTARSAAAALQDGTARPAGEGLLTALVDSGYDAEAAALTDLARREPEDGAAGTDVIDRIAVLHDAVELGLDDESDAAVRRALFNGWIVPRIFWVKDGLWLVEEDGSIDLELSIRTGALLIDEARFTNTVFYQSVGRQLIMSALSAADDSGLLPARLLFEADGTVATEGRIVPESLFARIVDPPAYPRHVSLGNQLGRGAWALTGAEKFTLRSTPRETTVTMDFPAGSIHHLVIKGIKEFAVLYMNGIRWNGDPNFQRYYAGWFYDAADETLYIKIRHRVRTETIRILYYDPDAPAETPAAESG